MFRTSVSLNIVALFILALVIPPALVLSPSPTHAGPFGTRDEAVAMVRRVQAKFKKDGPQPTFTAINAKAREFFDRDLYPFVLDLNGKNYANGGTPAVVGKELIDVKDQNGKFLVREMIEIAKNPGRGWSDIRWLNPVTKTVEDKSVYIERMGDYLVGVGIYTIEQTNSNTVSIISGSPNSDDTYLQIAYDLAALLNDKDRLRVLPVVGIGGPQNIRDVRNLKGIDIGLTQTNILNSFRRSNEQLGYFDDKIVYITPLFTEETHVVTRTEITSIEQLQGRKVNLDETGSGSNYSMRDIFKRLSIKVEEVNLSQIDALEKLRRGEIDATVLMAGKPAQSISKIKAADGLHFLTTLFPKELISDYLPAALTHDDYPELIPPGQTIDTIAVTAVLIAYNWPKQSDRFRRVAKFVEAFFPKIAEFQKPPRHVKWREVNLAAKLPGWKQFEPAAEWLDQQAATVGEAQPPAAGLAPRAPGGPRARDDALYREFLEWKRARSAN